MSQNYLTLSHRRSFDHLYTRQGFDRTATYLRYDGSSYVTCPCWYCGEPSTCHDHTYPLIALQQLYGVADLPSPRLLLIVPACGECNGLLGDRVFPNHGRRKAYVKKRLRQRYKRLLELPSWEASELAQLGSALQHYVLLGLRQQELMMDRLRW